MESKYTQTIAGLILSLVFLAAAGCSNQSESAENSGAVNQTQEAEILETEGEETETEQTETEQTETETEVTETEEIEIETETEETDPYLSLIEGEWIVVEYAGTKSDRLNPEDYTEEYWDKEEDYINTSIEETLGREFRIEPDNLIGIYPISDATIIIEDDTMLGIVTHLIRPEISLEAPYIGLSVRFQDDADEYYSIIIDNNGIVLIEVGACYFRMERKTEADLGGSADGEEGILYFSGEEYFPVAEGKWTVGEYLCGKNVYGDLSEERTDRIIEEYSGQTLCIERDNLGYFGPAFGRIYYPEDKELLLCYAMGMEVKDLSPMEGWYISAKVYLVDRDEWYYFIFDSTGRGIVRIQNRFFWLEKE